MFKQLKKLPSYTVKLFKYGKWDETFEILKNVELHHILIALAARLDNKTAAIKFRNEGQPICLSTYFEIVKFRKKRVKEDIFEWEYLQETIYGNWPQMMGLIAEYFSGLFDTIYHYDWKGKTVLDIGGFVGDSALFFLKKGAKKVIIFEPLSKNILALQYNLKAFKDKIEIEKKAVAEKQGEITLYSDEPEGGLGFGSKQGSFQIQCEGMPIEDILDRHSNVDIVKMDCEGGEKYLLNLNPEKIQSIPYWIVETHTSELYYQIPQKFHACGFHQVYEKSLNEHTFLFHFKSPTCAPIVD